MRNMSERAGEMLMEEIESLGVGEGEAGGAGFDIKDKEPKRLISMMVADVPLDLPAGTYRMDHPVAWGPGDGTVPIAARGLDTGIGWLDGESGSSSRKATAMISLDPNRSTLAR